MTRPLKPPRGFFIPTGGIFHPKMTPELRETFIHIIALTWGSLHHITPPLSILHLVEVTGKSASTLYGHIAVLRDNHAALRLQSAGEGQITIALADWLYPDSSSRQAIPDSRNLESPDQDDHDDQIPPDLYDSSKGSDPRSTDHHHLDHDHDHTCDFENSKKWGSILACCAA